MNPIKDTLFSLADIHYKEFSKKLTVTKFEMIGVRLPNLRKIAKQLDETYLQEQHMYFEEIMLEGMVIGNIQHIDDTLKYIDKFIPKIDNWSICDSFCCSLKITKTNKDKMFHYILKYKDSKLEYARRFLLVMLLNYYIEDKYIDDIFEIVETINSDGYYVKMAIAWLLSMCYIKKQEKTNQYLLISTIDHFTFHKTISKICDSYKVSREVKNEIKKLRRL